MIDIFRLNTFSLLNILKLIVWLLYFILGLYMVNTFIYINTKHIVHEDIMRIKNIILSIKY